MKCIHAIQVTLPRKNIFIMSRNTLLNAFVFLSACVLGAGKCVKSNYREFQSNTSIIRRCELRSSITVNNKPWVDSIYP